MAYMFEERLLFVCLQGLEVHYSLAIGIAYEGVASLVLGGACEGVACLLSRWKDGLLIVLRWSRLLGFWELARRVGLASSGCKLLRY